MPAGGARGPRAGSQQAPGRVHGRGLGQPRRADRRHGPALAQTPDGYLWIAGYGGVARYDGARILHMEIEPPQDIAGLAADGDGVMHVAPRRGPALCARGSSLVHCARKPPDLPAQRARLRLHARSAGGPVVGHRPGGLSRDRAGGRSDEPAADARDPSASWPRSAATAAGACGWAATPALWSRAAGHRFAEADGQRLRGAGAIDLRAPRRRLWALTDAALLHRGRARSRPPPARRRSGPGRSPRSSRTATATSGSAPRAA